MKKSRDLEMSLEESSNGFVDKYDEKLESSNLQMNNSNHLRVKDPGIGKNKSNIGSLHDRNPPPFENGKNE